MRDRALCYTAGGYATLNDAYEGNSKYLEKLHTDEFILWQSYYQESENILAKFEII